MNNFELRWLQQDAAGKSADFEIKGLRRQLKIAIDNSASSFSGEALPLLALLIITYFSPNNYQKTYEPHFWVHPT